MSGRFPFQAVLFDMDGVVVDNMPLHRRVWAEFATLHGHPRTAEELRALDGRRASDIIASLFGTGLPAEQVEALAAAREALYRERLRECPLELVHGVRDYLTALGDLGVPRIVATSATPDNVRTIFERWSLKPLFDGVISAADVQRGKPAPDVYLKAAALAGVPAGECLVVEDALPGIQAGRLAGAACLGLTTSEDGEALIAAGAHWIAPHFELLPLKLRLSLNEAPIHEGDEHEANSCR